MFVHLFSQPSLYMICTSTSNENNRFIIEGYQNFLCISLIKYLISCVRKMQQMNLTLFQEYYFSIFYQY